MTTTMTIRVSTDLKDKLERLAQDTRRSKSFLAAEAVSAYVERELAIVEGIMRSRDNARAGNVVSHEQAVAEVEAVIEATRTRKA